VKNCKIIIRGIEAGQVLEYMAVFGHQCNCFEFRDRLKPAKIPFSCSSVHPFSTFILKVSRLTISTSDAVRFSLARSLTAGLKLGIYIADLPQAAFTHSSFLYASITL